MFVMGIYPKPFLDRMEPSVQAFLDNKFAEQAVVKAPEEKSSLSDKFTLEKSSKAK